MIPSVATINKIDGVEFPYNIWCISLSQPPIVMASGLVTAQHPVLLLLTQQPIGRFYGHTPFKQPVFEAEQLGGLFNKYIT
jgi:hypothetical protein